MLNLFLLRHAKSSWDDIALQDIERPLGKRGLKDAPKMGKYFASENKPPQLIISSPARRARETAELFADAIDYKTEEIKYDEKLYDAFYEDIIQVIQTIDDSLDRVMIVGHNPGLTTLANYLAKDISIDNIPTCGIFAVEFDVNSWEKIETKKGRFLFFDYPKKH